ncbi:Rad17 cell cycle checkpoint protein-domain-containing protein [Scheffersomyces coipomensis]|uniref:Rad17 cell cycle checkpoint protein-domain-containing protein n=1 Tax=Scheffersomyces coipomensis TaxID=1788519 RepID=UPI00315D4EBA
MKRRKKNEVIVVSSDESKGNSEEEEDLIEDDEDISQDFIVSSKKPKSVNSSQKNPTPIKRVKYEEKAFPNHDEYQQWSDKYTPKTSGELCINPQKLKQVKEVLQDMIFNYNALTTPRLLILSGPAGSCKSTTIKVLANDLISQRHQNTSMLSGYDDLSVGDQKWIEYMDTNVDGINQSNQFEEFLNDVKYRIGHNLSVVILEELPNIFHFETLQKFRNKLKEWLYLDTTSVRLPPLVLCLTEVEYNNAFDSSTASYSYNIENNLTVETLLGKEIINSGPKVKVIKFNAIANKFVRKTINGVIKGERSIFNSIPPRQLNPFLDELVKIGDIRSILFNLQLWANNYVKQQEKIGKDDDNEGRAIQLESSFIRENQINLFHAIGKIIYSSSEFSQLSDSDSKDYYSIEQVLNNFNNSSLLNLSILENYPIYYNSNYDISIASNIVNDLSINDLFKDGLEANKDFGIRSTRNNLRSIVAQESSSNTQYNNKLKIKFPRHFKMIRQYNKTLQQIKSYQRYINEGKNSWQDLNMIDGYYLPIIYNKRGNTRYSYNRLGGKFQEIHADEDLPIQDNISNTDEASIYDKDQFQVDIENKIAEREDDKGEEDDELSDPIENSDQEDDEVDDEDGFSSDPELDGLISQGRV